MIGHRVKRVASRLGYGVRSRIRMVGNRPVPPQDLPIAAMTMCWNEEPYIRKWVDYYSTHFGRENLYILAHGGEDVVHDVARGCNIYNLPRRVIDGTRDRRRNRLVEGMVNFLLGDHRALIFGDVDEYIVADPGVGTLGDLVDRFYGKRQSIKPINLNILDDPEAGPLDFGRPVFEQRRLARSRYQFCKPVVLYEPATFVGGFHYSNHTPAVEEGLYLVHLHHADRRTNERIADARARTFTEQPGLDVAPKRNRNAWVKFMDRFEDYNAQARDLPLRPLDAVAPRLIKEMRANIVDGHEQKPQLGQTMTYGDMRMKFRIEVPDRFAKVF